MSKESKTYKNMPKKIYIRTFGCQMNVRDSEVIAGLLKTNNYELTANSNEAGVIIFNTCSVRQHAEDKVWSEIGRVSKSQSVKVSGKPIIGVVGCMANNYREAIFERSPQVDFVVGTADIHMIPGIIKKMLASTENRVQRIELFERKIWETDGEVRPEEIYHTGFHLDCEHAFVVISEGCENYCSYCVVPYVRGKLRSRNYADILDEIKEDIDAGIKKITLLGQNVNAYQFGVGSSGFGVKKFVDLLEMVNRVNGLEEFSFVTSHPKGTSEELFRAMAEYAKLKKYLHLPVQSGSDRILKLMNRGYGRKFYLDLAHIYRTIVKDGALTTDIIVGFPSETEQDFQDTYDLVQEIGFNAAYIFKYSPRPNTEALKFADDVTKTEKERRHSLILELQKKMSKDKK